MAFVPIKQSRGGPGDRVDCDKVYIAVYGSRENGKANHLSIRLGKGVAEKLGWTAGTKIVVLEGEGKEAGLLKLMPGVEGNGVTASHTNPKKPNGALAILPQVAAFQHHVFNTIHNSEPVEVQAFGGEMLLKLPEWVEKANEAANNG